MLFSFDKPKNFDDKISEILTRTRQGMGDQDISENQFQGNLLIIDYFVNVLSFDYYKTLTRGFYIIRVLNAW